MSAHYTPNPHTVGLVHDWEANIRPASHLHSELIEGTGLSRDETGNVTVTGETPEIGYLVTANADNDLKFI